MASTEMTERTGLTAGTTATGGSHAAGEEELSAVEKAAWLVEEAMVGKFDPEGVNKQTVHRRNMYVQYENMAYPERQICVMVLMVVSFTEIPLWCLPNRKGFVTWQNGHRVCEAPGHAYLSGFDYFPLALTLCAEVVCVGYLMFLARLESKFESWTLRLKLRAAFTVFSMVDIVVFLVLTAAGSSPWFRLAPYLRVGLLVVSVDAIYTSTEAVTAILPPFLDITLMLGLTICFFGWLGAMTLDDFRFQNHEGVMVNEGYATFHDGLYTTFFAATTANFPDQILPSYTAKRVFGLFFFGYECLAVFIFLNLILAVVYNVYSDHVKQKYVHYYTNRAKGLAVAYKLLAGPMGITRTGFNGLVQETNKVERVPTVTEGMVNWFFSVMDDDQSGAISAAEFYDVCDILQYSFKRIRTVPFIERVKPEITEWDSYKNLKAHVLNGTVEKLVLVALVVNSILVLVQSWFDLNNTDTAAGDAVWGYVEFLFSVFYFCALIAELTVLPFDEYWMTDVKKFDFFVTLLLFAAAVYWVLPCTTISDDVMHYLIVLRLLRLVVLITNIERFQILGQCIATIVPASLGVAGVLFASASLFAAFGVQFFGGLIYDGNPALDDTDYLDSNYDILNFNDFSLAFMPLFAMIVSGGPYTEFVEAIDRTSTFAGAGVCFFIAWYVVGCLIMVNIFSAFVIDAFLSRYEDNKILEKDQEVDSLDQSFAGDGYRIVATRRATTDDVYKAMFAEDLNELQGGGDP